MRILVAAARYEWLLQSRSARGRLALPVYLLACWAAPSVLAVVGESLQVRPNAQGLFEQTLYFAPFFTLVLAAVVVGNTALVQGEDMLLGSSRVSNAGWALRRLLVYSAGVLGASALAVLGTQIVVWWARLPLLPWQEPARAWLDQVAPLAVIGVAGWYGVVRLLRSEVAGLIGLTLGSGALAVVSDTLLHPVGLRISFDGWTGWPRVFDWYSKVLGSLRIDGSWFSMFGSPSETWPGAPLLVERGAELAVPATVALGLMALAVARQGRSERDVPPRGGWAARAAPGLARLLRGMRHHLRADGGLTSFDRGAQAMLAISGVVVLVTLGLHTARWTAVAEARYTAHVAEVADSTSRAIEPRSLRIVGDLDAEGGLEAEVELVLHHAGELPQRALAFELNRHLRVEGLGAVVRRGPTGEGVGVDAEVARAYDRVHVTLARDLEAGETLALRYHVAGTPRSDVFALLTYRGQSFAGSYERHRQAQYPRDRSALGRSSSARLIQPGHTQLSASDLGLLPRWRSWELTPLDASGITGREVAPETHLPPLHVELDLGVPEGWALADGCGGVAQGDRLRSACLQHFGQVVVVGGAREWVVSDDGLARVATLPGHDESAASTVSSMARVVRLSDAAWPNLPGLESVSAMERPSRTYGDSVLSAGIHRESVETFGQLILVPEGLLLNPDPLAVGPIVGSILTDDLRVGRGVRDEDEVVVQAMLRTFLLRRMGLGQESAWVSVAPWHRYRVARPILEADEHDPFVWVHKVPALLVMIERRAGRSRLMSAVERFVVSEGDEEATLLDLLHEIEVASGESMAEVYEDYFVGRGTPRLSVEGLGLERVGSRWRVSGRVRNESTGHVKVPVALRTDSTTFVELVEPPRRGFAEFAVELDARPHTLTLDPRQEVFQEHWRGRQTTFILEEGPGEPPPSAIEEQKRRTGRALD